VADERASLHGYRIIRKSELASHVTRGSVELRLPFVTRELGRGHKQRTKNKKKKKEEKQEKKEKTKRKKGEGGGEGATAPKIQPKRKERDQRKKEGKRGVTEAVEWLT
jgi:hypothetical protein